MSGVRTTNTIQIQVFLERNGQGTFVTNRSPNDSWNAYLVSVVGGGTSGNIRQLEQEWLKTRITALGGSVPTAGTLSDLWRVYLQTKGHNGDMVDMFNQWLDHGTI